MSEKGQGEQDVDDAGTGSGSGSAVGIDGGSVAGRGSPADQTGPGVGDTQTREKGPWSNPDPNAPEDPLGGLTPADFPAAPAPEEAAPGEPEIPGGGPTDTRTGWDEAPTQPYEPQGPPQETDAERAARRQAEQEAADEVQAKRDEAYGRSMEERDRRQAEEDGPQMEPPDLTGDTETPDKPSSVQDYFPPEENKPVIT